MRRHTVDRRRHPSLPDGLATPGPSPSPYRLRTHCQLPTSPAAAAAGTRRLELATEAGTLDYADRPQPRRLP